MEYGTQMMESKPLSRNYKSPFNNPAVHLKTIMKSSSSQKVYLIDDDVDLCKALRWFLESNDLSVEVFNSAIDFLKAYQSNCKGCLLIDVRMPEMNGLQLLEKLKSLSNENPVIMISSHADGVMAQSAIGGGAMDFVAKPFNDEYLLQCVQNALFLNSKAQNV